MEGIHLTTLFIPVFADAHDSETVNRFTWLQPERSPVDGQDRMEPERQRPSQRGGLTQRPPSSRNVWSLMDDEEILSPRDGLLSSVPAYNSEREEHRARVRSRIEGLTQSQENRSRETQNPRQAADAGNSRLVTRIRQMREAQQLSVPQRNEPELRRAQNMLSARDSLTGDPSWLTDHLEWDMNMFNGGWERLWTRMSPADEAGSSSTEAAAFFASGPTFEANRRPSSQLLRQRRLRLSGLGQLSLSRAPDHAATRPESPRPSPPIGGGPGAGNELEELLYPGSTQQNQAQASQNDRFSHDTSLESLFGEGMSASMNRMQSLRETVLNPPSQQPPQQQQQQQQQQQRNTLSLSSRPPMLPPIQLFNESSMQDLSSLTAHFEAEERPSMQDRRPASFNAEPLSRARRAPPPEPRPTTEQQQRGGDLAMHRALVMRSVQSRGMDPDRNTQAPPVHTSNVPFASRTPGGFQQGLDSLPTTRRQQYIQAHDRAREHIRERERERERELEQERERERRRSMRPEPHVRWGEVRDDPEAPSRPTAYRPIRARPRRSSMSALFAPPPENADTAHPNRGANAAEGHRGEGRTEQDAVPAEFFSLMGQRMRQRQMRERMREFSGRDETLSRSFFRRRHRNALGSFGDFVVSAPSLESGLRVR